MSDHAAMTDCTVDEALQDFYLSRRAKGCSPATLAHYEYSAGMFVQHLKRVSVARPCDVTSRCVNQLLDNLQARGVAEATAHAVARGTKALLRFWLREGYMTSPITVTMPRVTQKRGPLVAPDQLRKVLDQCHSRRDRALLLFLADTGVRRAETLALNWGNIDFTTGVVKIARGKGGKPRLVVIGAKTRRAVLAYRRSLPHSPGDIDPVWQSRSSNRLAAAGVRALMIRLSRKSGIRITPHMFRRTFATMSVRQGMDMISLQRLMGHADISMTARYVDLLDEDLVAAHSEHGLDTWLEW
ncbi:MAG: tyrosine-type recombinase/integrase [Chloroflexi bacterium]|nr:tyrosine-type recombinase/integrase [Chloroflexota bacterium]